MRSLTRLLLVAVALTVTATLVLLMFVDSQNVVLFNEVIAKNHWKFTCLRVIAFALLLGGMYGIRRWRSTRTSESDQTKSRTDTKAQLIRIGLWFLVVELLLGQGLVSLIIDLASP